MPSMIHEILADFFKQCPALAAELLAEVLAVEIPAYAGARLASVDLTEVQPAEYRADAVVVLLDDEGVPVHVIVVEVQLGIVARKRLTWPAYVTVSRAIHNCPVDLLIVAPDAAVAAWCAEPIAINSTGFVLTPSVLRLTDVPVVTDREQASRRPELAMLSVLAHGKEDKGAEIAAALLPVIDGLDDDQARLYYDLMYNSLNGAARRALEAMMKGYEYQSDFARKYVAQGLAEGLAEGLAKGRNEGLTEGLAKGRAGEAAQALLTVLRVRGLAVSDAVRERILAQTDPERLERWLEKAVVAPSAAAALDEPN